MVWKTKTIKKGLTETSIKCPHCGRERSVHFNEKGEIIKTYYFEIIKGNVLRCKQCLAEFKVYEKNK